MAGGSGVLPSRCGDRVERQPKHREPMAGGHLVPLPGHNGSRMLGKRSSLRAHALLFTGPFLILMALASLSYGFGLLPLGDSGWNWIGGVALGGAVLLGYVPELLLGKYRKR